MAKKKSDKPKAVCLPLDRLSIQIGFMTNVAAGYLFKMIISYCLGEDKELERLKKEVHGMSDHSLIEMAFAENKAIIDENIASYAAKCERNKQIAIEREQKRRAFLEAKNNAQTCTNVDNTCTDVNERAQSYTNTNTDTITKTSTNTITDTKTNTDTNSSSFHSEENLSLSPAGEEGEREWREVLSFINENCKDNLAQLAPLTDAQAQWIYASCSRGAWRKILSDLDDMPNLKDKHMKQFKAFENIYNHRKNNGTLEPSIAH